MAPHNRAPRRCGCRLPCCRSRHVSSRTTPCSYAPAKEDTFYAQLAEKCCAAGCCVELFAASSGFLDLATVGQLATATGGTIHRFPEFVTHASGVPHSPVNGATPVQGCQRLVEELRYAVGREVGFDAVWKLRTSKGVGVSQVVGNQDMRLRPECVPPHRPCCWRRITSLTPHPHPPPLPQVPPGGHRQR